MGARSNKALLADIGSTYTKLTAVDLDHGCRLASASAPTSTANVIDGFRQALHQLQQYLGGCADFALRRAASSAAGGLKLVAVGLVRDLTGEAARLAALGAGAKVQAVFSHRLQSQDLQQLQQLNPDIILLAGGTDGGDTTILMHNAERLADSGLEAAVVVAGNREVAPQAVALLLQAHVSAVLAENVMPRLGETAVDDARQAIRRLFLQRIVLARGLQQLQQDYGFAVAMPTPVAVLQGLELLAAAEGELLAVDVGGATTDVYSLAVGLPGDDQMIPTGLRPPFAYRSVEADLGLRSSAGTVAARYGAELAQLADQAGLAAVDWMTWSAQLEEQPDWVAVASDDIRRERVLAEVAVRQAVDRHAGRLQPFVTPFGRNWLLRGKDLRSIKYVIGIGGIFQHTGDPWSVLRAATWDDRHPDRLKPTDAKLLVDRDYVISAAGLLMETHPGPALDLMRQSLGLN